MLNPHRFLLTWCLAGMVGTFCPVLMNGQSVDFSRQILPILSDKCFVCHGPDTRNAKDLRLDSRAAAIKDLGGYHALDPDHPEKSALLSRIQDKEDPMPPEDAERQLTPSEKQLLKQWVLEGGRYEQHWAFKRPVKQNDWIQERSNTFPNPIDAFVAERLSVSNVTFAPEADKATLARRAALTLTGLPPNPSDLAMHLADDSRDAYARWIDQLLSDPKYGEHQARYWLDAIRYGDTHGLHLDNRRGIYPFRDWVVRSMNENLPFDAFITRQLAGDLMPDATLDQKLATGFVRMNPSTSEGGAIAAEFQAKNNFDRVETLGTVFLGMTMVCARCHTHKYDPVPQREYYELMAFFNNTAESPLDGNAYMYGPTLRVPENQPAWQEWHQISAGRDLLLKEYDAERMLEQMGKIEKLGEWTVEDWKATQAVSISARTPADAAFEEIKAADHGFKKGRLDSMDKGVWIRFRLISPLRQTLWLTFSGGAGSEVYLDGNPLVPQQGTLPDQRHISLPLVVRSGEQDVLLKLAGTEVSVERQVIIESPWQSWAENQDWNACDPGDQIRMLADTVGPLASLEHHGLAVDLARRAALAKANFTTTLVAKELEKPRETKLLQRGEYNMPTGDALLPGVLSVMGTLPEGAPPNRLGLAQWLTSPEHPVVSRVLINRVWQRIFGEALVRTPEDFGLQGQQPTHPELLDWLALEFVQSGWDLKHMVRLMMTSRAFKQSSAWRPDIEDPENRLFARGPSYRLDAEVLRDMGLWAAGILDPHMGGEGVKPYQPRGMWSALAHPASNTKRYERDLSNRAYRRSLYVYWKRTSPHPMMTLFDAPSREVSCVRRSRTNTSLQSLGLLNETQRSEMARMLARRLLSDRFNDGERLDYLFTLLACRPAQDTERLACLELVEAMRSRFTKHPEDAQKLLSVGALESPPYFPVAEHAAWTQLTATVLASDVAIMQY
ncbi:MAG: PSD1 and planctomycete cytochrome C domain-containing protein [Verrucomicrobiota bacterium]|nr:PSD1 and planctomycete cytochrome C domain-containing protein [Verrucomicrobiota bacterium]